MKLLRQTTMTVESVSNARRALGAVDWLVVAVEELHGEEVRFLLPEDPPELLAGFGAQLRVTVELLEDGDQ